MTAYSKQLFIFDLDGTLVPRTSCMEPEMAQLFLALLQRKKVAVISGSGYPKFETQLLRMLPGTSEYYGNLLLLPASGTRLYAWRGNWAEQYAEQLSPAEKEKITAALTYAMRAAYTAPEKIYGQLIEDRGSQITFSALGPNAPLEQKQLWDPTRSKREKVALILREKLSEFDVRIGGTTSIDITRRGVNKGYGIRKLEQFLKIGPDDILFVGDTLFYGGNDYPVKASGVDCIQVSSPDETKKLIESWLAGAN